MYNQPQPYQYQFQQPEEPFFSKTVFFSIIVAFLVLGLVGYGVFYFVNKKNDEPTESMEEIEEAKATKAKKTLLEGMKTDVVEVAEKVAEKIETGIEEITE